MTKKSLLASLGASVAAQTVQARDKFDMADLTMAMKRASAPSSDSTQQLPAPQPTPAHAPDGQTSKALVNLQITAVRDHPRNARHLYDPARIDEMAASIARDGQVMPVIVMADPTTPNTWLLIEGRYRKRALLALGRETIAAIVVDPLSELEAYRLSLILNEERNQQTDLDNAISWKMLQDDGLFRSQDHIAEYLGITQSKVSKTLSLLELPAGVVAIMKTSPGQFGLRIGYELRQLARQMVPSDIEAVAEQVRDGKLTVAALEKLRSRAEKPPVTRERSRAYVLKNGELAVGTLRDFDDGRLKIDLNGISPEMRQKLIAAVQKTLDPS